jgi:Tol biopolymer transport system component
MDIYIYKIKEDTIIGPITKGHPGNFSPDGKKFVFHRHTSTMEGGFESVYLFNLGNNTEQKLTEYGKTSFYPQISPDGKFICYESAKFWSRDSISCWQLHLMDINGNFIRDLTLLKNGYYAGNGVFNPDGQSIVCYYLGYNICKIDINTKEISYLAKVNAPYLSYLNPSISNNSSRVYFYSKEWDDINKKYTTQICSTNLEGSIFTVILNDTYWNSHPIAEKVSYYVYE